MNPQAQKNRDASMASARIAMVNVIMENGSDRNEANEIADLAVKAAEQLDDALVRITDLGSTPYITLQSTVFALLIIQRTAEDKLRISRQFMQSENMQ